MEYVGIKNIKKFCNFYVSKVHLSVMLLPYMSKQMDEDVEIITMFEEINKEDIEEVLNKINIKNKNKFLDLNWTNNKENTYENIEKKIKKNIEQNKNNIIIIGGKKEYIKNKNNILMNIIKKNEYENYEIKIINCYNVEEVETEIKEIVQQYDGILNTSGEILKSI